MQINEILSHVDHTLLRPTATTEEIHTLCDDAIKYGTASVCIPPYYVTDARQYVEDRMRICTVIGFPNGYNTAAIKAAEAADAVKNGADEIDMVINRGLVKDRKWDEISNEIRSVKEACGGRILKVIVETCELTPDIKTSTGFSAAGATFEDVEVFAENIKGNTKIKAAGGIHSIADAEKFLALGADRLGTSRIVGIAKEEHQL